MNNFSVKVACWEEVGPQAGAVRFDVFVREQKVPLEDGMDDEDARCTHALACDIRGAPIGTGRLLPNGHIGRMAVLCSWRGKGVGSALLGALLDQARLLGHGQVLLAAQLHARAFYAAHGFIAEGPTYQDAGIEHVTMRRTL